MRATRDPLHILARPGDDGGRYTSLLYEAMQEHAHVVVDDLRLRWWWRALARYDVVHLHYFQHDIPRRRTDLVGWLRTALLLVMLLTVRIRGARVVWTIHELHPLFPRPTALRRLVLGACSRLMDGLVSLSERELDAARAEMPAVRHLPGLVTPHGDYRHVRARLVPDRQRARRELGLPVDARVLLFFGRLRDYKGIDRLVRAFAALDGPDARLVIAGAPDASIDEWAADAAADPRITVLPRVIPEREAATLCDAADLCVLPNEAIRHSGSVMYPLSMGTPVLARDLAAFREVATQIAPERVRLFGTQLTPEVLAQGLEWARSLPPARLPLDDGVAWSTIAARTHGFLQELTRNDVRAPR